jgi:hypothetical protein
MESKGPKLPSHENKSPLAITAGLKVRTDLRAGNWQCRDCSGQIRGDQMLNPRCDYCQGA